MDSTDLLDCLQYLARLSRRYWGGSGRGRRRDRGKGHASHSEIKLMDILSAADGISAKELAEKLDIRPSSLSEALDRLEKRGETQRTRDEKDSRIYRITLTEQGRHRIEKRTEEYATARREIEACLTDEEKAVFFSICEKLIAHLISLSSNYVEEENLP